MEESSTLKLVMEKGPREGETLEFRAGMVVKIGRVVRGNTIGIKDAGISSKHLSIQFDCESNKWTLSDLESSNGTFLNGVNVTPNVPSVIKDGDCIKIGELTSIIVKIEVEVGSRLRRNPRRQGKAAAADKASIGLGFDGDLGGNDVEEPVVKRNLRSRAKKAVDSKNEVGRVSPTRTTGRSLKKEENASSNSTLKQVPEDLNVDEREAADLVVPVEGKKTRGDTRGRKRKLPVKPLEIVENSALGENVDKINESVQVDLEEELKLREEVCEGKETAVDENPVEPLENVENSILEENLENVNESVQVDVVDKLELRQEVCEGENNAVDENPLKGSSEEAVQADVDKEKEVAEELEFSHDACKGSVKDNSPDVSRELNLEKMTLGDFFDYLEVQLPKEIYEETEKIISDLRDKARKSHEFSLQRIEKDKGKLPVV